MHMVLILILLIFDDLKEMMRESEKLDVRARNNRYYQKNADRIREKIQKQREEHREEILADKKIYAQKKHTCECGCEVARNNLAIHLKTDKHLKFVQSRESQEHHPDESTTNASSSASSSSSSS